MDYPIHEMFATFQGEGSHMGMPAFFVRTFGCPVKCTFCDSAGTWHPDYIPAHVPRLSAEAIADAVAMAGMTMVVVTGGEPTILDLGPLTDVLHASGISVHLETSGAFPIRGEFDWIVCSPKRAKLPIRSALEQADEFKFIVEQPEDIAYFTELVMPAMHDDPFGNFFIWLHPEWSQRENPTVLNAIANAVKTGKGLYRAGWQIHKCYAVDALDHRTRALAPLGGNPTKGF